METEKEKQYKDALMQFALYFQSGNSVPVERAIIYKEKAQKILEDAGIHDVQWTDVGNNKQY